MYKKEGLMGLPLMGPLRNGAGGGAHSGASVASGQCVKFCNSNSQYCAIAFFSVKRKLAIFCENSKRAGSLRKLQGDSS